MKIAKYILLLLALFSIAFFVFVITQPSKFEISKEKTIGFSKEMAFDYIVDLSNFPNWYPVLQEDSTFQLNRINDEKNAIVSLEWFSDDNNGSVTNKKIFSKDSMHQIVKENNKDYESYWTFQEKKDSTLIRWTFKGKLTFKQKLKVVLQRGADNIFGTTLEKSLENIEQKLRNQFIEHTIIISGFTLKNATNYIQQKDSCSVAMFDSQSELNFKKLNTFIKQNNIKINGDPFVIIDSWDNNNIVYFYCIPVEEEIIATDGAFFGGYFDSYLALKTTLLGNVSVYRKKAWDKAVNYIKKNNYILDPNGKHIEIYPELFLKESKSPTIRKIEFYIPVRRKPTLEENNTNLDSLNSNAIIPAQK